MGNVIDLKQRMIERTQKNKTLPPVPETRVIRSNVSEVDFKKRTLVKTEIHEEVVVIYSGEYDMTHFETPPAGSNFEFISDKTRFETSEHLLRHINDLDLSDIIHFVSMGVLDKKEVSKALDIRYEHKRQS